MTYINTYLIIFILFTYSNYINLKFYLKLNEAFLISISLIILIGFVSFSLNYFDLDIIFIFYIVLALATLPSLSKNYSKINLSLNFEFLIIVIIIFIFSKDRYYLDQDELTYWGRAIKILFEPEPFGFTHHPQGLNIFRYFFVTNNFDEGVTIFSNNLILISGFYYLFYDRKLSNVEKFLLFVFYYLLLNNLSFGFLSIYSDPILAVIYACLLKKIFFIFLSKHEKISFRSAVNIFLISLFLLVINRASVIYFGFIFLYFIYLIYGNYSSKKKIFYLITISIILFLFFFENLFLKLTTGYYETDIVVQKLSSIFLLENNNLINFLKKILDLFISPIYFSRFGVLFNGILEVLFNSNTLIYEFQIPLIFYVLVLFLFIFFKFDHKYFIILSLVLGIIIYSIIVVFVKIYIENISLLALPRYVGIMIISSYLIIISNLIIKNQINIKSYIFLFIIIIFISITPKKTLGFIVPDSIYYSNVENKNYRDNRKNIEMLKEKAKSYDNIFIIYKKNTSDYDNNLITGKHTFYNDIIVYEIFPKKYKFIEYEKFISIQDEINKIISRPEIKLLVITYELSNILIKNINLKTDIFQIKTY